MPNKNYQSGRRFEYERKAAYEKVGWTVLRTAGSHGPWDLVCTRRPVDPVLLVQCKYTKSAGLAQRLLEEFRANPPLTPSAHYHQCLDVRVARGNLEHVTI